MRLLIFPFSLLKALIINNPFKSVLFIACLLCWYYAGTLKSERVETVMYHQFEMNGQWYCVYGSDPQIMVFPQKPVLYGKEKNIYVSNQYHPGNAFLWMAFGIFLVVLIVGSFLEDGWEFETVFSDGLAIFVRCDIEDGVFVYTVFGRLLGKYNNQVQTLNFHQLISIKSVLALPKYETKITKRERLLRILGV